MNHTGLLEGIFSAPESTSNFIILILAIVVPLAGAIIYLAHLQNKVNNLEDKLNNHPLLLFYAEYLRTRGMIDFFSNTLHNSNVENRGVGHGQTN